MEQNLAVLPILLVQDVVASKPLQIQSISLDHIVADEKHDGQNEYDEWHSKRECADKDQIVRELFRVDDQTASRVQYGTTVFAKHIDAFAAIVARCNAARIGHVIYIWILALKVVLVFIRIND